MTRAQIGTVGAAMGAGENPLALTGLPDANGYYTTYTRGGDYRLMTRDEALDCVAETYRDVLKRDPLVEANYGAARTASAVVQILVLGDTVFTHEEVSGRRGKGNG